MTPEFAVRCPDGRQSMFLPVPKEEDAHKHALFLDEYQGHYWKYHRDDLGPHVVVRRVVSEWEPIAIGAKP